MTSLKDTEGAGGAVEWKMLSPYFRSTVEIIRLISDNATGKKSGQSDTLRQNHVECLNFAQSKVKVDQSYPPQPENPLCQRRPTRLPISHLNARLRVKRSCRHPSPSQCL